MKKTTEEHPFSKNKGFQFLGVGKQEAIKYFFGGNAVISIVALVLITILLAVEAFHFFPQYKTSLEIYRKSGKEYVDMAEDQLKYQKEIKSLVTQVKQYELYHRAGVDAYIPGLFASMKSIASEQMRGELLAIKIAKKRISSKEMIWEIWSAGSDANKKAIAESQKEDFTQKLTIAQEDLSTKCVDIVDAIEIEDFSAQFKQKAYDVQKQDPEAHGLLKAALKEYYTNYSKQAKDPAYITDAKKAGITNRAKLMKEPLFMNLTTIEKVTSGSYKEYEAFVDRMRQQTLLVSVRAEAFLSSADRKKAIEEGIPEATAERRKELEIALERLINKDQDYDELSEQVYVTLPEHKGLLDSMMSVTTPELAKLPNISVFQNEGARQICAELEEACADYSSFMQTQRTKMENWRHDEKVGFLQTIGGFLFGNKWVANSSWHNFFGLRPLFGGSFFITIIAVCIATPFAVGAAIYVNRIATPLEQTIIKPFIELIQAIPSVVLAFLGVVVVGQNILKLSYVSWLDWVPGFPASGEQMMLTAGVLLAFMAIPTIFTLAEDAINNVPKSYNEASLALGASKLQTVFRVIVPCALSGIVAAIILGFGRIIGETMVVLLVAGGTINWPEVWTDPVHTMTGIIAQSTGEAAPGSIQYRALFLVGLVLFLISLVLNSLAQKVIKKFGNQS